MRSAWLLPDVPEVVERRLQGGRHRLARGVQAQPLAVAAVGQADAGIGDDDAGQAEAGGELDFLQEILVWPLTGRGDRLAAEGDDGDEGAATAHDALHPAAGAKALLVGRIADQAQPLADQVAADGGGAGIVLGLPRGADIDVARRCRVGLVLARVQGAQDGQRDIGGEFAVRHVDPRNALHQLLDLGAAHAQRHHAKATEIGALIHGCVVFVEHPAARQRFVGGDEQHRTAALDGPLQVGGQHGARRQVAVVPPGLQPGRFLQPAIELFDEGAVAVGVAEEDVVVALVEGKGHRRSLSQRCTPVRRGFAHHIPGAAGAPSPGVPAGPDAGKMSACPSTTPARDTL